MYFLIQIAVYGKSFNHSAKDAWELFQSTGVEALIAYDCSGAVLFMSTLLGGLISGTCAAVWTRNKHPERVLMVGSTAMLMGMILVRSSCLNFSLHLNQPSLRVGTRLWLLLESPGSGFKSYYSPVL